MRTTSDKRQTTILYIDTSDPEAVISLHRVIRPEGQGGQTLKKPQGLSSVELVAEKKWQAGRELSKTLSKQYSNILENVGILSSDIAGICVFVGPGSFTGLRIGISFANGLAFGLGVPVYETKTRGKINLKNPKQIAVPHYGVPPKITKSKKE